MKVSHLLLPIIASLLFLSSTCSKDDKPVVNEPPVTPNTFDFPRSETFTFSSNGEDIEGKIYFLDSSETNTNLPTIYLLDYQEQHFIVAKNETEHVIRGVRKIAGLDALVVTLAEHLDIDVQVNDFPKHYDIFKDMASYVDSNYTDNTSRTFIAKGSEAGVVLFSLFSVDHSVFNNFIATDSPPEANNLIKNIINNNNVPDNLIGKRLHFSFSSSNDRSNCIALINSIEEAQYPWLMFKPEEYPLSDYNNTYPVSFAEGLEFVFQ